MKKLSRDEMKKVLGGDPTWRFLCKNYEGNVTACYSTQASCITWCPISSGSTCVMDWGQQGCGIE